MIEWCGNIIRIYRMSYSKAWHIHLPKYTQKFSHAGRRTRTPDFLRPGALNAIALKSSGWLSYAEGLILRLSIWPTSSRKRTYPREGMHRLSFEISAVFAPCSGLIFLRTRSLACDLRTMLVCLQWPNLLEDKLFISPLET